MYKRTEEPTERFWRKVERGQSQDCWNYLGYVENTGYGRFPESHRTLKMAHRYAWEVTFGVIPDGLCVCHTCNHKSCCNPRHLYLATRGENSTDAARDGLYAVGEKNGLSKLAEYDIQMIRAYDDAYPIRGTRAMLSRLYGVSDTLISHICNRKIWKHI